MATKGTMLKVLKPLAAGLALAYLVTAFVDKPAPVHFQPDNPYASKQAEIIEPQTKMVMEKNIMKLGSPLSVPPDKIVESEAPVKMVEGAVANGPSEQGVVADNATDTGADNATSSVKGAVESTVP
jgi:hypothetical protein